MKTRSYNIAKRSPELKNAMLARFEELSGITLPRYVKTALMTQNHVTLFYELASMLEQVNKRAEDKCWGLVNWYVESTGDVNHAAEMKIWLDDEFGGHEK
jgi:hypothetical protein